MKRAIVLVAALLLAAPAAAEVCAVLNSAKLFERLDVVTDIGKGIIWSKLSSRPDEHCLNVDGDLRGDKEPTWAVILMPDEPLMRDRTGHAGIPTTVERSTPVVVWSRDDGRDWELMYSMWDYEAETWATPDHVERVDNSADDLDPDLKTVGSRLELTWRRESRTVVEIMWSQGELVHLGTTYDILWSMPEIIGLDDDPDSAPTTVTPATTIPVAVGRYASP